MYFMVLNCISFLALLLIAENSFSQKARKSKNAPPGTVQVNDTLYVDVTEVANVHWREYLHYIQKYDSTSLGKALPDTLVWTSDTTFNPLTQYYFSHPGFNIYPVVGVSYEQAIRFCQWRSDRVNELFSKQPESKRPFKKVTYRLLTKKEWEAIASGNLSVEKFPFGYDGTYRKWKGKYWKIFNCLYKSETVKLDKQKTYYTAPTKSFFKNSSGIYNMIGNVAEMVAEKGIAKGGSFLHSLDSCKIVFDQYYTGPADWLGFRCIAVVEK